MFYNNIVIKDMKKTERINIRCGELEFALIRRHAEECGLSVSDYCRQVLLSYCPRKRLSEREFQVITEVRKLTSDLTHITNFFHQRKYASMMEELKSIIKRLKEILYGSKGKND